MLAGRGVVAVVIRLVPASLGEASTSAVQASVGCAPLLIRAELNLLRPTL